MVAAATDLPNQNVLQGLPSPWVSYHSPGALRAVAFPSPAHARLHPESQSQSPVGSGLSCPYCFLEEQSAGGNREGRTLRIEVAEARA